MEYRITPAVDRCTPFRDGIVVQVFAGKLVKNSFTRCWVPFRDFRPFYVRLYIPSVSSYGGVGSLQGSSYICISVKLDPFRCPARDRKSPPQRTISSLNIWNLFHKQRIRLEKSINIQQSFRLGRRATLYRERLIKKEDFKRWDRRRSFSSSLVFIRQFWNRVCKRDHVRHKEIIIINRCAEIYSQRNSTGRAIAVLARIPSKVIFTILLQVDVKHLMDKNCHLSFSFLKNNGLLWAYVFPKKVTWLITAKQNIFC